MKSAHVAHSEILSAVQDYMYLCVVTLIINNNNYGIYIGPYTLAALWRFTILQLNIVVKMEH